MRIDRRQVLAIVAAGASVCALPSRAIDRRSAAGFEIVRDRFQISPAKFGPPASFRAGALPGGGLLAGWRPERLDEGYVRTFSAQGSPVGGPRVVVPEGPDGTLFDSRAVELVTFDDGSALFFYIGRTKGDARTRVYAAPLSPTGVKGKPRALSDKNESPELLIARRLAGDAAIVAWRSRSSGPRPDAKVRWRSIGKLGSTIGDGRTLARPQDIQWQSPLSLVGLSGGGAVLGFSQLGLNQVRYRKKGRLFIQRIGSDGEAAGQAEDLGEVGSVVGLAAMPSDRFMAFAPGKFGAVTSRIGEAAGPLTGGSVIDTKMSPNDAPCVVGLGDGRVAFLVSGFITSDRPNVVSAFLLDSRGAVVGEPLTLVDRKPELFFHQRATARDAVLLDGGDVLLVWSDEGPEQGDGVRPLRAVIVKAR